MRSGLQSVAYGHTRSKTHCKAWSSSAKSGLVHKLGDRNGAGCLGYGQFVHVPASDLQVDKLQTAARPVDVPGGL